MTDTSARPPEPGAASSASVKKVLAALLLPLFFIVVFPLMFVSALHNPTPHNLSLLVVGPTQVVGPIADGLDDTDEFAATHTDDEAEARSSVENRTVDGAILVTVDTPVAAEAETAPAETDKSSKTDKAAAASAAPTFTVTTYFANAEGRSVASTVQAAAAKVAGELGTTAKSVDVAPLATTDSLGVTLFYILTYTSLAAYLVIIVLTQVQPKARLRTRFAAVGVASVIAPLIVFGLSSIWVGDYGASFGSIMGLLGVNALYVFTVGSAAILIQQFLGNAATFGIMAFIVFLNFPSAGGAGPAALLPSFWQAIHSFYFGAGAMESFRSIIYFDGNGATRWILQLLAWTVGLVLATIVVHLAKTTIAQKRQIAILSAATVTRATDVEPDPAAPKHVKIDAYLVDDSGFDADPAITDGTKPRSISALEGADR